MVQGGTESIPYPQPMTMPNYSNMMMDGYHSAAALYPPNAVRSPQPIAKSHHPQSTTATHQLMYAAAAVSSPRPSPTNYTRRHHPQQTPAMGGPNYQVDMATTGPSLPPLSQLLPSTKPSSDAMTAVYSPPPPHQAPSHQAPPPQEAYEVTPTAYLPLNETYPQPQTYTTATETPESNSRGHHHPRPIMSPRTSTSSHTVPTMSQDMMPMQPTESSQMTAAGMHPLQTVEGIYAYHPMMNAPNYDGSMMHMPMEDPSHHLVHNQERHSYDSASGAYSKRQKVFSFVSLPGINQPKRPRRRYDEIERLYHCNWQGCNKSYGTLNHLNAHVSMQKHVSLNNIP
jgi:hypothetical protein